MPASAEEPALHSVMAGSPDLYKGKDVCLVAIDKPGMGLTPFSQEFRIRRDWPGIVAQVGLGPGPGLGPGLGLGLGLGLC